MIIFNGRQLEIKCPQQFVATIKHVKANGLVKVKRKSQLLQYIRLGNIFLCFCELIENVEEILHYLKALNLF